MTDPKAIVFCNVLPRYYGLVRSDIPGNMTGRQLLELRLERGVLDVSVEDFYRRAATPDGLITELPGGRSVLVKFFALPNGGSVATHEDCSEQRKLSRQLASTKQFLESVLDNVPVCVAAKSIEDGRYIFANRAFERFSRFSRDHILGKRADEIFQAETAAGIVAADRSALNSSDGQFRNEIVVQRGSKKRTDASTTCGRYPLVSTTASKRSFSNPAKPIARSPWIVRTPGGAVPLRPRLKCVTSCPWASRSFVRCTPRNAVPPRIKTRTFTYPARYLSNQPTIRVRMSI